MLEVLHAGCGGRVVSKRLKPAQAGDDNVPAMTLVCAKCRETIAVSTQLDPPGAVCLTDGTEAR